MPSSATARGLTAASSRRPRAATLKDTDFLGLNAAVIDTEKLHVELQYQKGWNIFDLPSDGAFGFTAPTENLGDIDWVGGVVTGKLAA